MYCGKLIVSSLHTQCHLNAGVWRKKCSRCVLFLGICLCFHIQIIRTAFENSRFQENPNNDNSLCDEWENDANMSQMATNVRSKYSLWISLLIHLQLSSRERLVSATFLPFVCLQTRFTQRLSSRTSKKNIHGSRCFQTISLAGYFGCVFLLSNIAISQIRSLFRVILNVVYAVYANNLSRVCNSLAAG